MTPQLTSFGRAQYATHGSSLTLHSYFHTYSEAQVSRIVFSIVKMVKTIVNIEKHRKNYECCPRHSLFKSHNVIFNMVFLNFQKCNQCFDCLVSGQASPNSKYINWTLCYIEQQKLLQEPKNLQVKTTS